MSFVSFSNSGNRTEVKTCAVVRLSNCPVSPLFSAVEWSWGRVQLLRGSVIGERERERERESPRERKREKVCEMEYGKNELVERGRGRKVRVKTTQTLSIYVGAAKVK